MGQFVITDYSVVINTVDLSDHVASVTLNYKGEAKENTNMGVTGKTFLPGLTDWDFTLNFHQDFAAGEVDATLFSLVGAAAFTCTFKPTSGAVSATNPSYSGSALLTDYSPISGGVGDVAESSPTFQGTGVLTRATA